MHCKQQELTQPILTSSSHRLPASVQALLESVWVLMMNVTDGRSACESFAALDHDGVFLKMYQGCSQLMLDGSMETFSGSWPKSGMMLGGRCMEPPTLGRRTKEIGSALWRTPVAADASNREFYVNSRGEPNLSAQVKLDWPTPKASDATRGACPSEAERNSPNLESAVKNWPTPKSRDFRSGTADSKRDSPDLNCTVLMAGNWATPNARDGKGATGYKNQSCLPNQVSDWATPNAADCTGSSGGGQSRSLRTDTHQSSGQLHPDWVETLMGYPIGWTDTKMCSKFDLFHQRSPAEVFSQPWPARRGEAQYDWEPPRTVSNLKGRVPRVKMLGNAVVPQWAYIPLWVIAEMEKRATL